jgi:putative phosphoesterase
LCNRAISVIIGSQEFMMRIGIISDSHDDRSNLETALGILKAEEISRVLHCGDLCGPTIVELLSEFDVWIARGNMDRHPELSQAVRETVGGDRLAESHRLTLDGHSIAMIHGHQESQLRRLISAGEQAYVFHGHTHRRRDLCIGQTRVINPGALGGMRWQQRSFCILDLASGEATFVKL